MGKITNLNVTIHSSTLGTYDDNMGLFRSIDGNAYTTMGYTGTAEVKDLVIEGEYLFHSTGGGSQYGYGPLAGSVKNATISGCDSYVNIIRYNGTVTATGGSVK